MFCTWTRQYRPRCQNQVAPARITERLGDLDRQCSISCDSALRIQSSTADEFLRITRGQASKAQMWEQQCSLRSQLLLFTFSFLARRGSLCISRFQTSDRICFKVSIVFLGPIEEAGIPTIDSAPVSCTRAVELINLILGIIHGEAIYSSPQPRIPEVSQTCRNHPLQIAWLRVHVFGICLSPSLLSIVSSRCNH